MNLIAALDVAPQRSTTPLDRPVSDSSDSGFAGVMSQVRKNGDEKPADAGTAAQKPAETQAARSADTCNEPQARPPATVAGKQPAPKSRPDETTNAPANEDDATADGQTLPVVAAVAGQKLPPLSEIVGDPGAAPVDEPAHPKPEDGAVDGDPSAALLFAALAPAPQPAVSVALPAPVSSAVDQSAASLPKPSDAATDTPQQPGDPAQLQAELDRLRDAAAGKPLDTRSANPATPQSVVAQATAEAAAQRSADQAPAAGSIAQTLRSFVRPQQLGTDSGTDSGTTTGQRRDPRIRSADAINAGGAAKTPIEQLASLIEGATQKDAAAPQHDTADASIRTDAVTQRTNGTPEAPRDAAATRLNDLAQLHAQRFAGELADRVLVLRSQRLDTATVTLEPRDLGRIDIQVRLQADTTHVAFTAQHAAVRDALEGQMPRLRAMLEDAGLSLGAVDVSHSGGQSGADAGTARSFEPQKSASIAAVGDLVDGATPWQRRVENALIDLHA
jgi:flagellar hook-length control protein FliK